MKTERNIPDYYIVVSRSAHAAEKYAAQQLQKCLYAATGKCFPYVNDFVEKLSKEIRVGASARNAEYHIDFSSLGEEGFVIKSVGEDILIAGATPRGTLYGVFAFLEKTVGFKAYTKNAEKVQKIERLEFPVFDITKKPAFEYRDAFFRNAFDPEFCVKNFLNTSAAEIPAGKGGCAKFFTIGHTFYKLLPPEKYFADHPEYFAMVNGKRIPDQPCLSHSAVFEIVYENLKQQIRGNPDCKIFSVAQNDVNEYCSCPECRVVNGAEESPAGTNIRFVNKIAEAAEKEFPGVLIHTFAYRFSRRAPKHIRPRENVIVRLCNIECGWSRPLRELAENGDETAANFLQDLRDWSKICNRLYIWDYAVNFHNYLLPFPNIYSMAENIKFFAECGVKGVFEQGNYAFGGGAALDDLKAYTAAKLLWNPDADPRGIVKDFCENVYGNGGKYIEKYVDYICDAVRNSRLTLYDKPNAEYFSEELIQKCEELFDRAAEAAESEEIRRRIEKERLSVEYLKIVWMDNEADRIRLTDEFSKKLCEYGITEIMEKTALDDSLNFMKYSKYTEERFARYDYLRYELK